MKKFNHENAIIQTPMKRLDEFDLNYTKGIEADSRILETKSNDYYKLKYILFYDYTTLIVDFSSNEVVMQKNFKVYEISDLNSTRGVSMNIDELEQKILYEENELEDEFE